jgi:acyl transferase domain-containing protein
VTDANKDDATIAVVGMSGRFPQAADVAAFWAACRDGINRISGWEGPREGRVLAGGLVAGQELFDPEAFGISPAEAQILDPQQRVFLELCWHALEDASIVPDKTTLVSVYAAGAPSRYQPSIAGNESENIRYQHMIANGPDYLATRVSYLLDLRGEAVNVQTACSSSLVAVHLACLSLQSNRSDVALAGGVSIDPEQERGYIYETGMITSPDGVCRPFDADARGAVPGNGAAVVVLQRLSDALAQRRPVYAVILSTAINNDGRSKSSFMAPNVQGQSEVIATALATANVPVESIGYLETHGTATRLGDSIEFEAASTAFRYFTDRRAFCALGALKANFGHLDRAAGVTGLIKAILAVRDGVIPPLLGFLKPNRDLNLADSPFRVPMTAESWRSDSPRRAGVSSFGVGGTNAHLIVEEFRDERVSTFDSPDPARMIALPLSAHSEGALTDMARELSATFDRAPMTLNALHTVAAGRIDRLVRVVVITSPEAASRRLIDLPRPVTRPPVTGSTAMLFPGQGAEVGYNAQVLADRYKVFRDEISEFAGVLGVSPERLLDGVSGCNSRYREFAYQPSLVAVHVALARLAEHLGIIAEAFCGNSLGEYAAAHMAGVFDRRTLMAVLAARDSQMRSAPEGRMLAVLLGAEDIRPLLVPDADLAGENWRDRVLISGPPEAISRQHALLEERAIMARVLPGRVAPHGRLMLRIAAEFRKAFHGIELSRPSRPVVSTLSGDWVDSDQLSDPEHWVRQLCEPFRFMQSFEALANSGFDRFVEAAPGGALTKLIRNSVPSVNCTTLGGESDTDPEESLLTALSELWCSGSTVDWDAANGSIHAAFLRLPPYPFQRRRFWSHRATCDADRLDVTDRDGLLERSVWRPRASDGLPVEGRLPRHVIVYGDGPVAAALVHRLDCYNIRATLSGDVDTHDKVANAVLIDVSQVGLSQARFNEPTDNGSLLTWLHAGLLRPLEPFRKLTPTKLMIVTSGLWPVVPDDRATTAHVGVIGVARCAPHDWPGLQARIVDLSCDGDIVRDVETIITELACSEERDDIAYRRGVRYRRCYESVKPSGSSRLRHGGTYLVLGGTGRLGAVVAEAISREVEATVVLVGRDPGRAATTHAERLIAVATARGCKVLRRTASTDDRTQLRGLLDDLTVRYGRIDGILHLAAHTETASFQLLAETTGESAATIAQAKVCTAAILSEELTGRDYDFVALYSSISTVIGANRFGAYVAANAYLESLAVVMAEKTGRPWYSFVWDGWTADGVAAPNGLGFDNGARLLLKALRTEHAVIAPVVQPLERRIAAVRADLALVGCAGQDAIATRDMSIAQRVLQVISDVTGHNEIDTHQNFASLGIDSLRLMQIAVRLGPVLGKALGIGKLLAAKSAEELTAIVTSNRVKHQVQSTPHVSEHDLSTPQERLWYLAQLDPSSSGYNVPFGWLLPPSDTIDVREAVLATLDQHEMLRSAYRQEADRRVRRTIIRAQEVPITEIELPPASSDASFDQVVRDLVELPFDLSRGSTRILIASCSEGIRLVFVCHHISIDAWSIKLLRQEILHRLLSNQTPPASPRSRYCDFVQWEHDMRGGPEYDGLAQYWRETLYDVQPTIPPPDEIIVRAGERPVGVAKAVLPREKLDVLRSVLQGECATLYAAALTGLSIALSKWCGVDEVLIGTNLANRMREQFESVVGMFVDPVVLRLAPGFENPKTTLGQALTNVRIRFNAAVEHTGIPYLDVVRFCTRRDGKGDNPLFSIIATMFDTEDGGTQIPSLNVPPPSTSKFALAVEFLPRTDGLLIHILYAADQYLPSTIDRFLARILHYLESLSTGGVNLPLSRVFNEVTIPVRARFARRFSSLRGEQASLEN